MQCTRFGFIDKPEQITNFTKADNNVVALAQNLFTKEDGETIDQDARLLAVRVETAKSVATLLYNVNDKSGTILFDEKFGEPVDFKESKKMGDELILIQRTLKNHPSLILENDDVSKILLAKNEEWLKAVNPKEEIVVAEIEPIYLEMDNDNEYGLLAGDDYDSYINHNDKEYTGKITPENFVALSEKIRSYNELKSPTKNVEDTRNNDVAVDADYEQDYAHLPSV